MPGQDDDIRNRVFALTGRLAPEPREMAAPADRIVQDLGYDSLFIMVLLTEIFDDLGLDLPDPGGFADLELVQTVGQLAEVIVGQVKREHGNLAGDPG